MTATAAKRAMEVDEEEDDPIPNELDNALVHLIPAITACGGDPSLPSYLDLDTFEKLAGPALKGGDGVLAGGGGGGNGDSSGSARRHLDARISAEIEVAFRHCMHEAGLALVGADADIGGGGGGRRGGGGRARKGKKEAAAPQTEAEAMVKTMSGPLGILSLALEFVSREDELNESGGGISVALGGLPMQLLEDFLESQGRKACKAFWSSWVEPNAERLTKLLRMQKTGQYTLIRLCKKLAQRMSKTHDSSFCGQIHMFLATALGFYERSGLNVTGGINHDNVTAFEDEEQFRRTMMGFDAEEAAAAASGDGSDPMEVDSAGAGAGGKTKKQADPASKEFSVDYPLYQSFWRLQKYTLQQDKAVKGEEAKKTWEALLADVDKILGAFEANAFSEHDLRLARERWAAIGTPASSSTVTPSSSSSSSSSSRGAAVQPGSSGKRKRGGGKGSTAVAGVEAGGGVGAGDGEAAGGAVYFGLKYLTSSRLLKLQLRDPTLRLQVLTQWLILAASLKSKVANTKECPNSVEDLKPRIELAKRLVRATPPRGEEYLGMLQIVLNRETAWTQWKDVKKCKDLASVAEEEEQQAAKDKKAGVVQRAPSYPNKRPRPPAAVAQKERAKHAPLGADFPLEKMVERLRAGVPSSKDLLDDQRMYMEDPDTPASEWPSASPLYTWRALRLLGRENPANLVGCYDGDLVKAMKRLDKAKTDAEEAGAAAEAASAAAAAAGLSADQPSKLESTASPVTVGVEAAAAAEKAGEGNPKAMAVDGEEDGEVELKKEGDTAEATAASATDGAGGASEGGNNGASSGDTNGVAAAKAPEEARSESEPVVVPVAATKVETPSPSDAAPASTPAATDAAATTTSAAAGNGDQDGSGGAGDGDASAAEAAPEASATASPEEAPSSSADTNNGGKKADAVAGWMAPVAGTRSAAASKKAATSPPPSPARATRRKGKSAQNGGGE